MLQAFIWVAFPLHGCPPFVSCTATDLVRDFSPISQDFEQDDHSPYVPHSQSTWSDRKMKMYELDMLDTIFQKYCIPALNFLVILILFRLPGQESVLQDSSDLKSPLQLPPFDSTISLYRTFVLSPPSHLLLHSPMNHSL